MVMLRHVLPGSRWLAAAVLQKARHGPGPFEWANKAGCLRQTSQEMQPLASPSETVSLEDVVVSRTGMCEHLEHAVLEQRRALALHPSEELPISRHLRRDAFVQRLQAYVVVGGPAEWLRFLAMSGAILRSVDLQAARRPDHPSKRPQSRHVAACLASSLHHRKTN